VRPPAKKRAVEVHARPYPRSLSIGNGIRPALLWSKEGGARPTHIFFV
jgi:hypothetical protein